MQRAKCIIKGLIIMLVITPKLSTGKNYGIVDIIVEFKKPIKKEYRAYLSIKSIKIKGKSQIPVSPPEASI